MISAKRLAFCMICSYFIDIEKEDVLYEKKKEYTENYIYCIAFNGYHHLISLVYDTEQKAHGREK
jgi:hypothetical protein